MNLKKVLWVIFYCMAVLFPSIIYASAHIGSSFSFIISGVFGITAYVLFAFQFLLASRPKIIDRQFGMDKIYRFHMYIAVAGLVLSFLHKQIKENFYQESFKTTLGDLAFNIFLGISVLSILMMVNKLFFKTKFTDSIRGFLNKTLRVQYQYKVLVHNAVLIALCVLLVHILMAYSVKSNILLESVLVIYFAVPLFMYLKHKIYDGFFNKSKKYTVAEVINESDNIVTLKFKHQSGKTFSYLPGQFLYLRIKNAEIPWDEHPFTISSSPLQEYLSITAKKLGDFTERLDRVKIGDTAYIDGAYGTFSYLKNKENRKLCFLAGGIGITPFLGMLRHMSLENKDQDVILFWGVRNSQDTICDAEIKDYSMQMKNFRYVPVLSNESLYDGEKGYINADIIKKYIDEIREYDFYICGPPVMIESQIANLRSLGVAKDNIHFERFAM